MTVFLLLIVVANSADTPKSAVQHKNRFVHRRGRYEKREGQHAKKNTEGNIGQRGMHDHGRNERTKRKKGKKKKKKC